MQDVQWFCVQKLEIESPCLIVTKAKTDNLASGFKKIRDQKQSLRIAESIRGTVGHSKLRNELVNLTT